MFRVVQRFVDGLAVRVAIHHHALAARAAEELVSGQSGDLSLDVPQGHVHRRDRRHRHRSAAPVRTPVQVLPGVLDALGIAAEQAGHDVVLEVTCDRELPAVERRIADAGDALVGGHLQRDEIAARAGDDHLGIRYEWSGRHRQAIARSQ